LHVRFEPTEGEQGVAVVDEIERRRLEFRAPGPVGFCEASPDRFRFPASVACELTTDTLDFDAGSVVFVRQEGRVVARAGAHETLELEAGQYTIDLSASIRLYLLVEGPLTVETGADYVSFRFDEPRPIVVGARSFHERPAATITTTDEPETMMRALSHLSSSLKTVSPEQSFPTLRGHPPEIELGDSFDVPAAVADRRPETGVRLVVPPEYDYLYPVASLAFYLGARITPGSPPRLRTRDGFEYRLTEDGPFEDTVAGLLQQVLFLDCVVRTEGIYRLNLYERVEVEDRLPFDPAAVYELPPGPRLSRYLEIPYVELEPYLPRWGMTVHLPARPAGVEALPFVAANLGIVRSPRGRRTVFPDGTDDTTGGAPGTRLDAAARQPYIVPDRTDESVEHAWFADALPLDATKAMVAAYRNGLDRTPATEALHITVVCNDRTLARETEALDTVYGFREEFPFRIDSYRQLSVAALERVLRSDTHFLHYIGDAGGGLDCPDGRLDAATLEDVAVDTFLLNAPESAEQGMELIEAGAVGGVATLGDVARDDATEIGRALARLLNLGFTLGPAVELVQRHAQSGDRYIVVGDGMADIAQSSGPPAVCDITRRSDGDYDLSIVFYPKGGESTVGSVVTASLPGVDEYYLSPGRLKRTFVVTETELMEYLRSHSYPIRVDGELRWNDTLEVSELS
jgi:hypothetical protein